MSMAVGSLSDIRKMHGGTAVPALMEPRVSPRLTHFYSTGAQGWTGVVGVAHFTAEIESREEK